MRHESTAPNPDMEAHRRAGLEALFRPRSVVFVGGRNMETVLRYHRELGFAGETWALNPKYESLGGFPCFPDAASLPAAPDLAYVSIPREASIEAIGALRRRGCRAVVANAAGFAELGADGADLQARLADAVGDMALLGPNSAGLVNYVDPMAAILDHFGVSREREGVAVISQGGGLLCDAAFCERSMRFTHLVGCGNQAVITVADCLDYVLDDPRVRAVGLSFEGLADIAGLRRAAAKAARLGKPIVALKFGRTAEGARASSSHTASMTGPGAGWDALFARLGIARVETESEFFETLKLFDSGQIPKGRRAFAAAASGVMGVMLADRLVDAGFSLPQPGREEAVRAAALLPGIATPGNPQDITMAAWNDEARQTEIYKALLAEDAYDIAIMAQNYPREGMWDVAEYAAQMTALGRACEGRDIAAMQLAPLVDCFPEAARAETRAAGLAPMQGLDETLAALNAALFWRERREALLAAGPERLLEAGEDPAPGTGRALDEAAAKARLAAAGVPTPRARVAAPEEAAAAAAGLGFPVVLKALDARLSHKTELGAVRLNLSSEVEVAAAVSVMAETMAARAREIPLTRVLVERMAERVVAEAMASISHDPAVGRVMMIASGGVEAELWGDQALIAFPASEAEIEAALDRLKLAKLLAGWRGRPAGDRAGLVAALHALARFAEAAGAELEEVEVNPILVCETGVVAADATLTLREVEGARDG